MTPARRGSLLADTIADRLAHPSLIASRVATQPWWRQSLAHGAPGVALLHIERAAAGLAPWQPAQDWLTHITREPITAGPHSHPFYGAPALGHVLACAAGHPPGSAWQRALDAIDHAVTADTRRRTDAAHSRIDAARLPELQEFDAIRGLAGLGAYLLRRDPHGQAIRDVLGYLVRLTEPIPHRDTAVPGWWTATGPAGHVSGQFPAGHGNLGVAHGISGPLTVLALAARRGITVPGHHTAINTICTWLDGQRTGTDGKSLWPYWATGAHRGPGQHARSGRQRLAWCYGTAGVARTLQLAALATGNTRRQQDAEHALTTALADPAQTAMTTSWSICHGKGGLAQIAAAAASDATSGCRSRLQAIAANLRHHAEHQRPGPAAAAITLVDQAGPGFLDGAAGAALTLTSPAPGGATCTGWERCLLIT